MHNTRIDRRRLLTRSTVLGTGIAAFPALQTTTPVQAAESTFTLATNWAPNDIDPHSGYDPGSNFVLSGIYENLVRQQPRPGAELAPWLAESWDSGTDFRSWTFRIRPDVVFQDGSPLTAQAARDSFVRQMKLQRAPSNVLSRFFDKPEQIVVVDELTLRFDLGKPQPVFGVAMAAPAGAAIMNVAAAMQHEVDGDLGLAWCQTNAEGLGTGPYQLRSFDIEEGAVMERFDDYWRGWSGNHFDTVVVRVVAEPETRRQLVEQGEVDLVENVGLDSVDDLEQNPDLVVDRRPDLTVRYLAITQTEPLLDPLARQALCWAFPYEETLGGIFLGYAQPAQGAVSANCNYFSSPSPLFSTDLDKARELFEQAGVPEGTRLTTVAPPEGSIAQSVAELFQYNLQQIGIELEIETMDYAAYIGLVYSDVPSEERPHLFPAFWSPDYDDAWSHLNPTTACTSWLSGNAGHYCNDQVDEQLQVAKDAADQETYRQALAEVQQIVAYDDPAGIYFAMPEWITVLRSDIGGFVPHPVTSTRLDYYALHRIP